MAKFKIGDKVRVRSWKSMEKEYGMNANGYIAVPCSFVPRMSKYCGMVVTIRDVTGSGKYLIEGDEIGWLFSDQMFEPGVLAKTKHSPKKITLTSTSSDKITIYTEGKKVIAVDKASGKTGIARCHPEDKFDFYLGAEIALARLKEQCKKPEYYSGEIVCTKALTINFTKGKIYTVKDGKFIDDVGKTHGLRNPFISFEDLTKRILDSFIEIVR